jgi:hypothetical protein
VAQNKFSMMAPAHLRQADLYWKQLAQLKAACICIRLYRNRLQKRVRLVDIVKAVASSAGIGAWVVWKQFPFIWTAIIVAAQVLDALKGVFPFAKDHRAANDLTVALEVIYIDAEDEWEAILAERVPDAEITKRRTKLRKLQLEAERKHFPDGIEFPSKIVALANDEAETYFALTFNPEAQA